MTNLKLKVLSAASIIGSTLAATPAQAQALQDDFWIQASGFWASVDTDVRVASTANPDGGTEIDLEDDFGLDDSALLPAVFLGARLGGGWQLAAEYYSVGRDTTGTISRNITVDDVTYPANATVTAGFDTDIYRFTVGYAFVRNEHTEVGAALGLHATNIDFSLSGQGTVGGAPVSTQARRKEFLAPLPTIGLFANFEVSPGLTVGARADYLSLSVGDYDGELFNGQASIAYRITKNIGIGAAYRYVAYNVGVSKPDALGEFDYDYSGPSLFLEVGF
jgi:hypothetical protein